jgi:hypothetical protein
MFKACLLCATHFQLQNSFYILLVSKKFGMCQTQYILETGQATSMKCPYTSKIPHPNDVSNIIYDNIGNGIITNSTIAYKQSKIFHALSYCACRKEASC